MNSEKNAATPTQAALRWLEGKIVYSVGFGILFLLAVGAGLFYFNARATSATAVVRIAYGAGGPGRTHFLEQMALRGKARNLDIRLVVTDGADQTMSLIDQGATDLGLITGAIEDQASRKVFELAPLFMEPLQLLVREPLYDAVSKDFGELRGKSIGLDGQGSATNLLATELLRFIGLAEPASGAPYYSPVYREGADYLKLAAGTPLPDAIFQVGSIPSPATRNLITAHNYRLVPLPFGDAFNLDKFREAETPPINAAAKLRLDRAFVEEFVIPAFTYGVLPPVPPIDTRTIATRLMLIGRPDLDEQVVHRILDLILSPEISSLPKPDLSVDLLKTNYQFQRHPGTERYLLSLEPVDVESAFVAYARLGEVWGVIIALYIAAGKGLKAWRNRKVPERKSVGDFLVEVLAVEAEAGASCSAAGRIGLDQRLSGIKKAAIELHLEGHLEDAEELPSLLVSLADTRTKIWGPVG